jgi:hypothetical protein
VVTDGGQDAGKRDFDRSLGALVVVRRLLDVPFAAVRILDRDTGIGPLLFALHECVDRLRLRRALAPPGAVHQIAAGKVVRVLPQLRQRRLRRRHGRLNLGGAEWVVQRNQERKHIRRRVLHVSLSFQGTNGATAERPDIGNDRLKGSLILIKTCQPSTL